jgi:hypothetical protein
MYTFYFVFSVLAFFRPEVLSGLDYYDWPRDATGSDVKLLSSFAGMFFLSAGAAYAAASQLGEGAQRKFVQYSMIHPAMELFSVWRAWGSQPENRLESAAFKAVAVMGMACLMLYVFNKKSGKASKEAQASKVMLWVTRFLYCSFVLQTCVTMSKISSFAKQWGYSDSEAVHGFVARLLCVQFLWAATLIGAAQGGEATMKKFLQYSMVQPTVWFLIAFPAAVKSTWDSDANGWMSVYFFVISFWLRLTLPVIVCYPSGLRTWVFRASYIWYFLVGYLHLYAPEVCGFLFAYQNGVAEGAEQIGFFMISLSLCYMSATRTDAGYTQLLITEYTMYGEGLAVVLWFLMKPGFPLVLACVTTKIFLWKVYDVVADRNGWESCTFFGLFPGEGAPTSMKMKNA